MLSRPLRRRGSPAADGAAATSRARRWRADGLVGLDIDLGVDEGGTAALVALVRVAAPATAVVSLMVEGGAEGLRYVEEIADAEGAAVERPGRGRLLAPAVDRELALRVLLEACATARVDVAVLAAATGDHGRMLGALREGRRTEAAALTRLTVARAAGAPRGLALAHPGSAEADAFAEMRAPTRSAAIGQRPGPLRASSRRQLILAVGIIGALVVALGVELARSRTAPPRQAADSSATASGAAGDQTALPSRPLQTRLRNGPAPAARMRPAASWDRHLGELVLFGGAAQEGAPVDLGDTWTWRADRGWRRLMPPTSPPARTGGLMTWTPAGTILTGGISRTPTPHSLADTWRFDGVEWQRLGDAPPQAPIALATDPGDPRPLLVVRDEAASGMAMSSWRLVGGSWVRLDASTPSLLLLAGAPRGGLVGLEVEGGQLSARAVTWRFSGSSWSRIGAPEEPEVDVLTAMLAPQTAGGGSAMLLIEVDLLNQEGGAGGSWTYDGAGWRRRGGPIPAFVRSFDVSSPVLAEVDRRPVLLGGGATSSDAYRHAAVFDGSAWHDLPG